MRRRGLAARRTPARWMTMITLLLLVAVAAGRASGAAAEDPLRPLAFLAGACWTGSFADGKTTDTHCFEWVYGGRFLRDRHVVRGAPKPYEGESLYAWNPQAKKLVYTYWASDGGYSTGEVEAKGDELVFSDHYVSASRSLEMQSVWRRQGEDAYSVEVRNRQADGWKPTWSMTLRRDATSPSRR